MFHHFGIVLHDKLVTFVHLACPFCQVGIVLVELAQPLPSQTLAARARFHPHDIEIARRNIVLGHSHSCSEIQDPMPPAMGNKDCAMRYRRFELDNIES